MRWLKSSGRHHLLYCSLLIVVALGLLVTPISAQPNNEAVNLTLSAAPSRLVAGEETQITVALTGQAGQPCVSAPTQPADVVLVIDVSGSMSENGKLESAQQAALAFLSQMDWKTDQAAIVAFSDTAFTAQELTPNRAAAQTAIASLTSMDMTDLAAGLREGTRILSGVTHRLSAIAALVLLSDGKSDPATAEQASRQAQAQGIVVYAVSLGDDADRLLMQAIASSPSHYYHAPSAAELNDIYRAIQTRIASTAASQVVVHALVNSQVIELVPQDFPSAVVVMNNVITWTVGTLTPGQTQALTLDVKAIRSGEYPALNAIGVQYNWCGDQPHSFTQTPGPTLVVIEPATPTPAPTPTPTPIPPCVQTPLGNDCAASLFCVGGFVWPCSALGLPWWVCLLTLALLMAALALWLWQRRKEQQRRLWQPSRPGTIVPPALDAGSWQPLPEPSLPSSLPVVEAQTIAQLKPTLVIGLGEMGQDAIGALRTTLIEAFGETPSQVRWLTILPAQLSASPDVAIMFLPLNPEVARKAIQPDVSPEIQTLLSPEARAELETWLLDNAMTPMPPPRSSERIMGRLAVLVHYSELKDRLQSELKALGSATPTIYLIGSLAEGYASGALLDVAQIVRLQAQKLDLSDYAFHGLMMLPDAHKGIASYSGDQDYLQQAAFAAWREMDRFQSVFDRAFKPGGQAQRKSKLFDRCYLFSPNRSESSDLTGRSTTETLYPSTADLIIALADSDFRPAWETTAQGVDDRASRQQQQDGNTIYSSLGSFTYVLPVEDLVQLAALRLARELVATQLTGGLPDARRVAIDLLAQPLSSDPASGTALMQDVVQRADLPVEQAQEQMRNMGSGMTALLSPISDNEAQQKTITVLHDLTSDYVVRSVRTSAESGAEEYGADTQRFVNEIEQACKQNELLDSYLQACLAKQATIFQRLVGERLSDILNPPDNNAGSGLMAGRDLLQALEAILVHYRQAIDGVAKDISQESKDAHRQFDTLREALQSASNSIVRRPRLDRLLLTRILPASAIVIGLGLATLAAPTLLLPLGGVALLLTGGSIWNAWHTLQRTPSLVQQQIEYRQAAQNVLALEVESRLYIAWQQVVDNWLEFVQSAMATLHSWYAVWNSPDLSNAFADQESALLERCQSRRAIAARCYLDDDQTRETLYARHVAPVAAVDKSNRFVWSCKLENNILGCKLIVTSVQRQVIETANINQMQQAILDIGRAYASPLRTLQAADVLAELYSPEGSAQACGEGSAPWIHMAANEQPSSESHRFVAVAGKTQASYFEQVIAALRRPAAEIHSEQQAVLGHPYRCVTIASLDLLLNPGLLSWSQAQRSYASLPRRQRALLHVFQPERVAACYESLLARASLARRIFSPQTALLLENERRARAFWQAFAYGWVQEAIVERVGVSPLRRIVIALPDYEPVPLTEPREEPPSLLQAALTFVSDESEQAAKITDIVLASLKVTDEQTRQGQINRLEKALERAKQLLQERNRITSELGAVLYLIIEDALRKLEGEPGLVEE